MKKEVNRFYDEEFVDEDNETLEFDLSRVRDEVDTLWILANVYTSSFTFNDVPKLLFRIYDRAGNE